MRGVAIAVFDSLCSAKKKAVEPQLQGANLQMAGTTIDQEAAECGVQ
jgi:hypothetical protein